MVNDRSLFDNALMESQKVAACLLCDNTLSDLDKLIYLSDYVAAWAGTDKDTYVEIMTQIILGVDANSYTNVEIVFNPDKCRGWGRGANDCPDNGRSCANVQNISQEDCRCSTPCPNSTQRYLSDTGFHPDFRDSNLPGGGNQIYHLWASVGPLGIDNGDLFGIALNYSGLQIFHEFVQGRAYDLGELIGINIPFSDPGGSIEDYNLTSMGMILGLGIGRGDITPQEVGNWLQIRLGTNSRGIFETAEYQTLEDLYYAIVDPFSPRGLR